MENEGKIYTQLIKLKGLKVSGDTVVQDRKIHSKKGPIYSNFTVKHNGIPVQIASIQHPNNGNFKTKKRENEMKRILKEIVPFLKQNIQD